MALRKAGSGPGGSGAKRVRGSAAATLLVAIFLAAGGCGPGGTPAPAADVDAAPRSSVAPAADSGGGGSQPVIMTDSTWTAQGPAPMQNGGVTGVRNNAGLLTNEVSGAVHAVAAHPTNAKVLWIGAVNGGIWRTTNATAANPTWTPQGTGLPSPSIGALEIDPTDADTDPDMMTLVAGAGRFSSFGFAGGPVGRIYRTTNGGMTWTAFAPAALDGENISGLAARGDTLLATSNANGQNAPGGGGLFRSTDAGATWNPIAGNGTSGLPLGVTTDLVGVPVAGLEMWFYTAVLGHGIYVSMDGGVNWGPVSAGTLSLTAALTDPNADNCELAVNGNGRLFAAVLINGRPSWIGFSNGDTVWQQMHLPRLPASVEQPVEGATNATPIVVTATDHGIRPGDKPEVWIEGVTGNTNANGIWTTTRVDEDSFSLDGSAGNGAFNNTGTWRFVVGANPRFKPGSQGQIHFSIGADPGNGDLVYVGGDRQDDVPQFPNYIRADAFHGQLFRGNVGITVDPNAIAVPSPQWDHMTHSRMVGLIPPLMPSSGGTMNNSAPHADSRELTFDATGQIIQGDDGGIYRRTSPPDNTGDWFSLNGNLHITEMHDVAYDAVSNVIISGNQDNGTSTQLVPDMPTWTETLGGDGGDVKVDDTSLPGSSLRYFSSQRLGGFRWRSFNAANNMLGQQMIALTPLGGAPPPVGQFVTPIELNTVDMRRMIIGAENGIYESMDQGATVSRISMLVVGEGEGDAIAYGGRVGNVDNQDVLYVGAGTDVYIRTAGMGAPAEAATYPGTLPVRGIVLDPDDWNGAYVCDNQFVRRTLDTGGTWEDITGNLAQLTARFHCIEYVPSEDGQDAVVVGTDTGVYARLLDAAGMPMGDWAQLGQSLPNALVWDLDYDRSDDVLVAGTLGRAAWKLTPVATDPNAVTLTCPQGTVAVECNVPGNPGTYNLNLAGFNVNAPAADFPLQIEVSVDGGMASVETGRLNMAGMFALVFDGAMGRPAPLALGLRTVQVTVRSMADANRSDSCTLMIDVQDTTDPTINCPADMTVPAMDAMGAVVNYALPPVVDNCDLGLVAACAPPPGTKFPVGETTVTCTATDSATNTGTCTFKITVVGNGPVITCPADQTIEATSAAGAMVPYPDPVAMGGTAPLDVVCTPASNTQFALGTTTVTCTVTDAQNRTAMCTFDVIVQDTTAPVLACPPVINRTSGVPLTVSYTVTATDAVTANPAIACDPPSGSQFPVGTTPVTCTATDAAGNVGTCTFNVVISPDPLTITCPGDQTVEATSAGGAAVAYPLPTTTGGTGTVNVACDPVQGATFPLGTTLVTCTATDGVGATATCTFNVIVEDTTAPVVTCPDPIGRISDTPVVVNYPAPMVMDAVSAGLTATCTPASGSLFPLGNTTVTCTATDGAGNTGMCTFTVTVDPMPDPEPPVLTCPDPITVEAVGPAGTVVDYPAPTVMDNKDMGLVATCTPPAGALFPLGTTLVTCTATDMAGNTGMCTFNVTVQDTTAPVVTCPQDMTVTATSMSGAIVNYPAPTVTDAVSQNLFAECTPPPGSMFAIGTTQVTCTATDGAGNTGTCTFTVTVEEAVQPLTIMCPPDPNAAAGGSGTAVVTWDDPTTDGGVAPVAVVCAPASGSTFTVGTTIVTCTATDMAGTTATCMFAVTVTGMGSDVCAGELRGASFETDCWIGAGGGPFDLTAVFLDGFAHDSPEIDRVAATWTDAFRGPVTGLQDVLTVESVTPNGDGTARVRLRVVADASAFPGESFGTAVKRVDVVINGHRNVGIANFVGEEIRRAAFFSWNPRCGERAACPAAMLVDPTCPERFEPRYLATSNVGMGRPLPPAAGPEALASGAGAVGVGPSR